MRWQRGSIPHKPCSVASSPLAATCVTGSKMQEHAMHAHSPHMHTLPGRQVRLILIGQTLIGEKPALSHGSGPCGLRSQVVVQQLLLEEQVPVTPRACRQGAAQHHLAEQVERVARGEIGAAHAVHAVQRLTGRLNARHGLHDIRVFVVRQGAREERVGLHDERKGQHGVCLRAASGVRGGQAAQPRAGRVGRHLVKEVLQHLQRQREVVKGHVVAQRTLKHVDATVASHLIHKCHIQGGLPVHQELEGHGGDDGGAGKEAARAGRTSRG
mmetsp:Transcript_53388/g.134075  ORF Transcript_53388/g.134075 Transcript_53388/m.134075 type:complete len:270 (-) Transcript_53388:400-1209(-)